MRKLLLGVVLGFFVPGVLLVAVCGGCWLMVQPVRPIAEKRQPWKVIALEDVPPPEPEPPPHRAVDAGDNVLLDRTFIARTLFDLERALKLMAAKDHIGIEELEKSERVLMIEPGGFPRINARVIERQERASEVRLMSGKHNGKSGWILNVYVHPTSPAE